MVEISSCYVPSIGTQHKSVLKREGVRFFLKYILSENLTNHDNQADVIKAFNSTTRYLDDLLNTDTPYFEGMVKHLSP